MQIFRICLDQLLRNNFILLCNHFSGKLAKCYSKECKDLSVYSQHLVNCSTSRSQASDRQCPFTHTVCLLVSNKNMLICFYEILAKIMLREHVLYGHCSRSIFVISSWNIVHSKHALEHICCMLLEHCVFKYVPGEYYTQKITSDYFCSKSICALGIIQGQNLAEAGDLYNKPDAKICECYAQDNKKLFAQLVLFVLIKYCLNIQLINDKQSTIKVEQFCIVYAMLIYMYIYMMRITLVDLRCQWK